MKRLYVCFFIMFVGIYSTAHSKGHKTYSFDTTFPSRSKPDCSELAKFRDEELYKIYNTAYDKYTINKQALEDINKIKNDLISYKGWEKSDAGLLTGLIAQNLKTTCNLITNLLKLTPTTSAPANVMDRASLTAVKVYNLIEAGATLQNLVEEGAEKTAYKEIIARSNPVGAAVKTAMDFSEDVNKMLKMSEDRDNFKNEVQRIMIMLENEILKYNTGIIKSKNKLQEIEEVKKGIDSYIRENCKNLQKIQNTEKIQSNSPENSTIAKLKEEDTAPKNSFYIFFYASIRDGDKTIHIYSHPILYKGDPDDEMLDEKASFTKQVANQIPSVKPPEDASGFIRRMAGQDAGTIFDHSTRNNKKSSTPKTDVTEILAENNYNNVSVNLTFPYKTLLLNSKEECYAAIEEHKRRMKKFFEGLEASEKDIYYNLK